MIILEIGMSFFFIVYLLLHLPAILALIFGIAKSEKNPESSKKMLIFALVYFIIGGGMCGAFLN